MQLEKKTDLLLGKVDSFILDMITDPSKVKTQEYTGSLTWNRFDIAIKINYLDYISGQKPHFMSDAYIEHIKAFSLGTFNERGNENKNSISDFLSAFKNLFIDISTNGFDTAKSYIPLAKDGSILNGAHRAAISKFLKVPTYGITTDIEPFIYDYKFFKSRGVSDTILDSGAIKYAEESNNCYLAFLWPSAQTSKKVSIEKFFKKLVYSKSINLNYNGAHNLLSIAYDGEEWLGNAHENYPGVKNKLVKCFPSFGDVKVFLFEENDLSSVLALKEAIREKYGIGKHSIHITDTKAEVLELTNLVFNNNGVHFLNNAYPNKFKSSTEYLGQFKTFIHENKLDSEKYVLDSGMVLAIYGLRDPSDIDFITTSTDQAEVLNVLVEDHSEYVRYHTKSPLELVFDPRLYFKFRGIKFVSLSQLKVMKQNRNEVKDRADLTLINSIDCVSNFQVKINKIRYKLLFFRAKALTGIKLLLINLLNKLGLYTKAREIYRKIKGKSKNG